MASEPCLTSQALDCWDTTFLATVFGPFWQHTGAICPFSPHLLQVADLCGQVWPFKWAFLPQPTHFPCCLRELSLLWTVELELGLG